MAMTLARLAALCVPLPKRKNKTLLAFEIGPSSVCVRSARAIFLSLYQKVRDFDFNLFDQFGAKMALRAH
jgi:hypothetical protein